MAGARRCAGKTRRGDQERLAPAEAGLGAFRIGDARNRQRRFLGRGGAGHQMFGRRLGRVHQVERDRIRRRGGVGETGIGVLGHHPRHRHGALGQSVKLAGSIVLDETWRPAAQEHPQPEVAAFGALDVLGLAQPALHRQRRAGDQHRIGRIRAGRAGTGDQVGEKVKGVGHGAFPNTATAIRPV